MFEIGKQVICKITFDGRIWSDKSGHKCRGPINNQVLTVRDIVEYKDPDLIGLKFFEINEYWTDSQTEVSYNSVHFRPCKNTSIECFTGKLKNKIEPNKTSV